GEAGMAARQPAGEGWHVPSGGSDVIGMGIAERVDDYCAVAFVLCAAAQPVARVDLAAAIADVGRLPYETR
ncbi:MAG TPA: hypothetical protein VKB57_20065, partial [Acidimicrobiales bacterium]|nr:hypothetical protein [Acidimicrobiales bacterium]